MKTVLNFDRVVLVKELNEKFKKVGEVFEVANIFEDSFLLRDGKTRVAIGVVSFEDFENCFVHETNFKGWTKWTLFTGFDGQSDCMYRTNRKKVQVKFITNNIRAEACCCKNDDFNLSFGIRLGYLRCLNSALNNQKNKLQNKIGLIDNEISDNESLIKNMIKSLE